MSLIPSTAKIKAFAWGMLGFAVTAYAVTRLTPGLAAFVGLTPGGRALPNTSILTLPNVNELLGRSSAPSAGQPSFSPFTPAGQDNIINSILA